jgi:hypothetical protein
MIDHYDLVLWLHVAVMGYWLGSDFVINATTHYFKNAKDLDPKQRMKLWDFILLVDQHPRNALILSLPLGFQLAADLNLSPIQGPWLVALWVVAIVWFIYIWVLHYQVGKPAYKPMSKIDLTFRYGLIAVLFVTGVLSIFTGEPLAAKWLGVKVTLFSLIICCGLGIRYYIAKVYAVFPEMRAGKITPESEAIITHSLNWGSYVLYVLWALMLVVGYMGAAKPF